MNLPVPAILFLIFNRPDTTRIVFDAIRKAKPAQLYIAADGPRPNKPGEAELCEQARKVIKEIDWPCEVRTLLRSENLGCKNAIRSSIDWFFDHVEEGIIIEDDCLPDESFFGFCALMLEHYRNDDQVKMIAGTNFLYGKRDSINGYYFSAFMPVWGWATWRRAWSQVTFDSDKWDEYKHSSAFKKRYPHKKFAEWLIHMCDSVFSGKINAWSLYMLYSFARLNGVTVSSYRNLVRNIGYSGQNMSTLEKNHPFFNMPLVPLQLNSLAIRKSISIDRAIDKIAFANIAIIEWKKSIAQRIWIRLVKEFKLI